MASKFSNKFLIPENFPKILHDFTREVVRYQPKDILDFSIQYFYCQEKLLPLNYIEGASSSIKKIEVPKQKHERAESQYSDGATSISTNYRFNKNQDNESEKAFTQNINTLNINEIDKKKIDEDEEGEKKSTDRNKSHTTFSGISGDNFEKKEVRDFANDLFSQCKKDAIKNKENYLDTRNKNNEKETKKGTTFSGMSCTDSQKQEVRDFYGEVIADSMAEAKEKIQKKNKEKN